MAIMFGQGFGIQNQGILHVLRSPIIDLSGLASCSHCRESVKTRILKHTSQTRVNFVKNMD